SRSRVSGISRHAPSLDDPVSRGIIRGVGARRTRLGSLSLLLVLGVGVGLVSVVLPDEASAFGYYDGDDDDAVVAPERMAVLVDLAVGARAAVLPERAPEAFESPVEPIA